MDSSLEVLSKEEGLRLLKAGHIDEAIKVLEKVREKTDDAQACAFLGAAYSQKGNKVNAIHAFEESLRLNETPKAYFNLAVVYESVGRADEAVREYRMAVELDPNYAPAQEAIKRIHDQFAATHPPPEPAITATKPTQSMPASQPVSQTQSFSGPPAGNGHPPQPLADPFARQHAAPPTQDDLLRRQMEKEQKIADQHHSLMKNGLIYGAICGSIFFVLSDLCAGYYWALLGGFSLLSLLIAACIGAVHGSLVGLWVGYTCGGEGAGFQAGAALGVLLGIVLGLLCRSFAVVIVMGVIFGLLSGVVGLIIGRLVDMSISD